MEEQKRMILTIASRILSYPSDTFLQELSEIREFLQEDVLSFDAKVSIEKAIEPLWAMSLKELRETYVAAFDLKKDLGLYLTSHELGDSPKRGAALIKLQKIINTAGFERVEGELADYMPMLFEFLAVATFPDQERLERRLATATQIIFNHLSDEHPYFGIFSVLMSLVFPKPTAEEIQKLEQEREEADLEPMPYPIMYQ
jgi:nitrate reductase molybdenum cofactor assembly chaperone NarJ/NarW